MRSITLKAIFTLLLTALMGALIYWVGTLPPIVIQTPTEPQPSTSVTTIPTHSSTAPHVHDFTYAWASDNQFHWNVCLCGKQANVAAHSDLNGDQTCDVCLASVAPDVHIHYFPASWVSGENDHWHSCLCGEQNEITPHMDLDGSQTCDVCEAIVPASLHQHNFGSSWYFYESYHWRSCLCGETTDIAAHTDLDGDRTCDTCTVAVPSTLHQHLFVDQWDSDETDHWHTCLCGERNEILPHEDLNGDLLCDICETTVPSTLHQHLFAIDWTFDDAEHWHSCLCGERDDVMSHEDVDGNQFCDICECSVSPDFHQHLFGSGWNAGEDTHWHSCLCGEHNEEAPHEDANGNLFCDICQTAVPATLHQHLFDTHWSSNADNHWHRCLCGQQSDVGVHTDFDGDVRCDTCQDRVSPLLHQHQFSDVWNTSDNNHWHSCLCGEQSAVAAHTDVNGDQRCDACQATVAASLHQHNFATDWSSDDVNHWYSCLCGEQREFAAHTDINGDQRCDTCAKITSASLHQHQYGDLWLSNQTQHWQVCICNAQSDPVDHIDLDTNGICDTCAFILLSANSALIYDCAEETYLFQNQPMDLAVYPASITKLFTAYVALQYLDPADLMTLGDEQSFYKQDASKAGFEVGDQVSVDILLHGLLLKSGSDCAYGLAAAAGRKILNDETADATTAVAAFMAEMNRQAQLQDMGDTNFVTPDGYHNDNHYISFHAFVTIAKCAIGNAKIMEVCGTQKITMYYTHSSGATFYRAFTNTNVMLDSSNNLYIPECVGLKTGSTNAAGKCFLGVFLHEGEYVIIGVFGCASDNQRWQDMHTLWNYYLTNQA